MRMRWGRAGAVLALGCGLVLGAASAGGARSPDPILAKRGDRDNGRAAPEAFTGRAAKPEAVARRHMVVTANSHATRAGLAILRAGGSAADAAIAAALVLGLVEPQSSGLGGGGFLLHWDARARKLTSYDGRETAPMAARPDRFLLPDGRPRRFADAVFSGLSVGVPGFVRLLARVHGAHGRLAWARLFAPAIRLAEEGFPVSERLHKLLARRGPARFGPRARAYFFDEKGRARPVGYRLRNPVYARTLALIAERGADAFYEGPLARRIVEAVRGAPRLPGDMTLGDLAAYRVKVRPPVCTLYRGHRVCGMGPPSSGGLAVAQVLALLAPFDLGDAPMNPRALHLIAEAEKLAYADRNRYVADPDAIAVPAGLLDPAYIAQRRGLIDPARAMSRAPPGLPPMGAGERPGRDNSRAGKGTSHLVVVDGAGNAVSMTVTIEAGFGARRMVGGFLLNNELTDFAFRPRDREGRDVANRVGPGKRPRSSMAPTMVFDGKGRLVMLTGSPGGSRIILYVLKTLIAHLDWRLGAGASAALANFGARNRGDGLFEVEPGALAPTTRAVLERLGHKIAERRMVSGAHIIIRGPDGRWHGGADPRREGVALGD